MKFIISSNIDYYQVTTTELVESLLKSGVDTEDILVSVGRSSRDSTEYINGVLHHFNMFDCFEYNAVHSMRVLEIVDGFFLMHDTCLVGETFKQKFDEIVSKFDLEKTIALRPAAGGVYSNSIGYYPSRYVNIISETTEHIHNIEYGIDKKRQVMIYEDMWFKEESHQQYFCTEEHTTSSEKFNGRLWRFFPQLDFIKFQANHAYSTLRITL